MLPRLHVVCPGNPHAPRSPPPPPPQGHHPGRISQRDLHAAKSLVQGALEGVLQDDAAFAAWFGSTVTAPTRVRYNVWPPPFGTSATDTSPDMYSDVFGPDHALPGDALRSPCPYATATELLDAVLSGADVTLRRAEGVKVAVVEAGEGVVTHFCANGQVFEIGPGAGPVADLVADEAEVPAAALREVLRSDGMNGAGRQLLDHLLEKGYLFARTRH